jgi:hypothetical protein
MRNTVFLVGELVGKRPLGRPRRVWKNNIRTDLREILGEGVDECICLRMGTSSGLLSIR